MPTKLRVKTKLWDQVRKSLPEGSVVHVGVLAANGGNATVPGSNITMIELAAIHEFGSPAAHIPERSFIRSTLARIAPELNQIGARYAKAIVNGKMTGEQALGRIGAWAASQIKATIKAGIQPALKPATIARKGSSLPLVDTGRLINAITWAVKLGA